MAWRQRRLLEANKIADEYFREQLASPGAVAGQQFLSGRGFTSEHAHQFGVGYAPQGWDHLLKHLQRRGFREDELRLTGLFSEGQLGDL